MLSTYFLFLQVIFGSIFSMDTSRLLPRAVAMGYGGASRISLNETTVINPAASAYSRMYSIEMGYGILEQNNFYVSISDNKNSKNAGGGAYYSKSDDYWQLNFVINKLFMRKRLAVGFGLDYKKFSPKYNDERLFAPSAGAMFLLTDSVVIGAYVKHILEDSFGLFPRTFAFGFRWSFLDFISISADLLYRDAFLINTVLDAIYKWGGAITIGITDNVDTKLLTYSGGLGFYFPKLAVYYAVQIEELPQKDYQQVHSFSLRVFF